MKKLSILIFAIFISLSAFAEEFEYINLDEKTLQQYSNLITTRHIASDYADNYNTVWLKFDTYNLTFKNRDRLPSTDWNDWINSAKHNNETLLQISACYPADNSDIINELGPNTNNYFNALISDVKIGSGNQGNMLSSNIVCAPLRKDNVKQSMIKIIRLQKIQQELRNFVYGDNSANQLESSLSQGHRNEMGASNFSLYSRLSAEIKNIINKESKTIDAEIDRIWAEALKEKKYVSKRNLGYIDNVEMIKISKNWLIGLSSRLPNYLIENPNKTLVGQGERILEEFKTPNIEKTTMIKAKMETLDPVKHFDVNEENMYISEDFVLLYLPDNEIPDPVNKRWSVDIFVPVTNSKMIQEIFTASGHVIDKVRVRGEILELQRSHSHEGTAIFLNNGKYKGCMIGYCIDWSERGNGGKMVQLFTENNVKFIEDIISNVTPNEWPKIRKKIIFE